ncbi:MAG: endonuclease Q family protein [Desulfobacterales bacterium]|nr:endonuclease Q family protein [Desulfobacterales bacterium]
MRRAADLHIHSRHSIATSSKLTPPYLDRWARVKGLDLMGTGDCTHPAWLAELGESLEPAAEGLFRLSPSSGRPSTRERPWRRTCRSPGRTGSRRFVLTGEISTIYSRGGRTRKVHHLVILPDFEAAPGLPGAPRAGREHRLRRTAHPGARLPGPLQPRSWTPTPGRSWSPPTSGPPGSPPWGSGPASTPSRSATGTWRAGSRRSRRGCPPTRR